MDLETKAREFATAHHKGQKRLYTGEDYITHPAAVVEILRSIGASEPLIAAGWLHDTVEDCDVSLATIQQEFGSEVALNVYWVTNPSCQLNLSRQEAKEMDRLHLSAAPADAQTLKLADILHNTPSIIVNDPKFAETYIPEKKRLLSVLTRGDRHLWQRASTIIENYYSVPA